MQSWQSSRQRFQECFHARSLHAAAVDFTRPRAIQNHRIYSCKKASCLPCNEYSSTMLKCKHVSSLILPHTLRISSLVYQDQLIECQGIMYKTKDRTESWKRYRYALISIFMGWARCESTPDSIPTIGNTRIESRAQDPQRSSRLFRWMGSFAWKFCKPAACLVRWPGALVPLRAFTLT